MAQAPPILDMSSFYGSDAAAKAKLVDDVRTSCLHNGFFQIVGHRVPSELQEALLRNVKALFALSKEEKQEVHKDDLEQRTVPDPEDFKRVSMEYFDALKALARDILVILAHTLDLGDDYFDGFTTGAVATLRYLHYPPQPADSDEKLSRGIGAHTDFGSVTLLMQDDVDGLQVYEKTTNEWLDVVPTKGAYVVNLGNMFMRWSNDKYISNLHRVINKSGKERYSVPFFFSGNPDHIIECLPNCRNDGEPAKYPPISVQDCVGGSYKASYGAASKFHTEQAAAVPKADVSSRSHPVAV